MLIKKNKLKEINKNKVNKVQMGQAAKQEKKYNSGGLGRKRCRLSFDPVKSLDRRCMRVFDLDMSSFDLEIMDLVRS